MKSFRALFVVGTLAVVLCALGVAPALANSSHVFSTAFGEAGSGDGQLELRTGEGSSGVAVNSGTHDVYVADTGNHRVDEFSPSGAFVRAWGWGVADGTTEALQVCTSGCHAGLPGAGAGQLSEPTSIAVDNSSGPSQGDVYVSDGASVAKFSASGAYISTNRGIAVTFPVAGPFAGGLAGIAVDASGNLWVYGDVQEPGRGGIVFEFAQDGSFITDWQAGAVPVDIGIAIDSAGNLDMTGIFNFLDRYTSSGAVIGTVNGRQTETGVAVDAGDNLFLDEAGERIKRYAPSCDPAKGSCTPVESFGAGGELNGATRLAVDASNDTVYVSNVGNDQIAVFGRTPDTITGPPANRTATTATLSGTVQPDNTAVSDCHFEYVADSEYHAEESNPYATGGTVPCDVLPAGSAAVAVHAETTGLAPGMAYHFRLQATNVYGTSFGGDETVPGTPPAVLSTSAANVTSASAELRATINPDGGDTTYHFEYGTTTAYGASIPAPDADIGSGVGIRSVSRGIQGLHAGTVYHYRVVAHNPLGTIVGPDSTLTTPAPSGATGVDTCSNAAIRAVQHATTLPDCRAYEQVAPPNRGGAPIFGGNEAEWQAAADGSAIAYTSSGGFADEVTGGALAFTYIGSRTPGGWSTHALLPPQAPDFILPFPHMLDFSQDLSRGILADGTGGGGGEFGQDDPPIVPGEPPHNANLFLRDNSTNSYQLIDLTPPGATPAGAALMQASSDLSHVAFTETATLTPNAPAAEGHYLLYDWSGGVVHLLGVFPNGTPIPVDTRATVPTAGFDSHAVSADGSRIYFETDGSDRNLYLRQGDTSTVQVDASHGPGPGGGGRFAVASSDGSQAYFSDDAARGLTSDTVAGSGLNLYRYDANSEGLVDITPAAHAEVVGVLGASQDGSYVYYVANGVLAPGASSGNCVIGAGSPSETCNLYVSHGGATTFIGALNGADYNDWTAFSGSNHEDTAVVSPDGRYLAFESLNSLTGYENVMANGGVCKSDVFGADRRCREVFLYDAAAGPAGSLDCASCNPNGGAPAGSSLLAVPPDAGALINQIAGYMPRYLSDSGRLFFNSRDALVPQDVNGQWDVYEYEPARAGSCGQGQGCISLISSGASPSASLFIDASVTGDDVFFRTSDQLVAQDGDQSTDLYDAKVGGGLTAQNETAPVACGGEACRPPAAGQPADQITGSSGLTGAGNLAPSAPLSSHGKPVKKKHPVKKKRHPKKRRRARGRRATHNRGGAK
jgi:hypothetical protein